MIGRLLCLIVVAISLNANVGSAQTDVRRLSVPGPLTPAAERGAFLGTVLKEIRQSRGLDVQGQPFCGALLDQLIAAPAGSFVEPALTAQTTDDPSLYDFMKGCGKNELFTVYVFPGNEEEWVKSLTKEEKERYGEKYVATRNVSIYDLFPSHFLIHFEGLCKPENRKNCLDVSYENIAKATCEKAPSAAIVTDSYNDFYERKNFTTSVVARFGASLFVVSIDMYNETGSLWSNTYEIKPDGPMKRVCEFEKLSK